VGAALAALAAACAFAASARAGAIACAPIGYSYAGLLSIRPAHGVTARITALSQPNVRDGHVAAWVGVGGVGAGPDTTDEWLQVGVSAFPDRGVSLYYELALPGEQPAYTALGSNVQPGSGHNVAVLEMANRSDYWRVWVDGSPKTQPIHLPASHGRLAPVATAESWDGGAEVCNGYGFRFDSVKVAARAGGNWTPLASRTVLQDPGYHVKELGLSSFLAGSRDGPLVKRSLYVGTAAKQYASGQRLRH
jgi:hypothetical protein